VGSSFVDLDSLFEQLTPEAVVAALLQTQFIVYFIVCCVLVAVLMSLSDSIGSEYIFIDLSIVAIFGKATQTLSSKKKNHCQEK
jgi:hypothetical protein